MRIDRATVTDIRTVSANMRERDFIEFSAVCAADTRQEMADMFVERYTGRSDVICGSTDEEPVAIGLVVESRPNVVTLGFLATDEFPLIAAPLTRFIHRLFRRLRASGCHRIECVSIDGYEEAHRWLEVLGLRHEAEHPGYGKRGEKFHTYAWVKIMIFRVRLRIKSWKKSALRAPDSPFKEVVPPSPMLYACPRCGWERPFSGLFYRCPQCPSSTSILPDRRTKTELWN